MPLGRGQRELILGDRATGKTAIALDAILAQRGTGVVCIYAAIGLRKVSIAEVVETLSAHDALARTVVVAADADAPPGQQYLAPFAACTIGEYFMRQGKHVLVVYDDLTKHADAYRRISLLLGRPPAREAYPADVFYLHARLAGARHPAARSPRRRQPHRLADRRPRRPATFPRTSRPT